MSTYITSSVFRIPLRTELTDEANDGEAGGAVAQVGTLNPNPRSLYLLWDEYENGIGGERQLGYFQERREGKSRISSIDERLSGIA